ncbi:protein of unknown function [Burkholderia multivorans]
MSIELFAAKQRFWQREAMRLLIRLRAPVRAQARRPVTQRVCIFTVKPMSVHRNPFEVN